MKYSKIKYCDMVDGPGLRLTLFVSGCDHHCQNCFNPETHDENFGSLFTKDTLDLILNELQNDYYTGFTFLGGDPLFSNNRETILYIAKEIKNKFSNKDIFLYTGYTLRELKEMDDPIINELFNYIDYLADGRFIESLKSPNKHWVGSENQNVYKINHSDKDNIFEIYND